MQPWEQQARQLPFAPRPAPGETVISYLARLAAANDLDPAALLTHIAGPARPAAHTDDALLNPAALQRLARITGRPALALGQAMPTLRLAHATDDPTPHLRLIPAKPDRRPHRACRDCMARRHHTTSPVIGYLPDHVHLCVRHAVWLRDAHLDVAALPELTRAQRRHTRLTSRHPSKQLTSAIGHAEQILAGWEHHHHHHHPALTQRWEQRRQRLASAGHPRGLLLPSRILRYPELVALAALLASPSWPRLAVSSPQDEDRFLHEANHRLGVEDLHRALPEDPLLRWVQQQRRRNHSGRQTSQPNNSQFH